MFHSWVESSTLRGFDPLSLRVWPLASHHCAITSTDKSWVRSVDPMAPQPTAIICDRAPTYFKLRSNSIEGAPWTEEGKPPNGPSKTGPQNSQLGQELTRSLHIGSFHSNGLQQRRWWLINKKLTRSVFHSWVESSQRLTLAF